MGMSCSIEGCFKLVENRDLGLCATHNKERRKPVKEVKPKKQISKVSDKMKDLLKLYDKLRIPWIKGKKCRFPGCQSNADQVHHMAGRIGPLLLDVSKWFPICTAHHIWVTEHSNEAIEMGISLKRNSI